MSKLIPEEFNDRRSGGLGDLIVRLIEKLAFLRSSAKEPMPVDLPDTKPAGPKPRPNLYIVPK
jgi:hypothetical protein